MNRSELKHLTFAGLLVVFLTGCESILPNPDNVRMERAGSQRWLVVDAPPEKVWPVIREFWNELGFAVRVENPETGVMETEWVDPSSITKDDKGNYLDKFQGWLDKLNTLQTRQKFRTRIDRGENNATEIYMSHRSVADAADDGKERVRTSVGTYETGYRLNTPEARKAQEARANSEDIDAELLRRLMVRLGVEEQKSKSVVAAVNNEVRATINREPDGTLILAVNDQFDRAWRRVGLALDRVGFVVEDRDRSRGLYYVRYADLGTAEDTPEKKKGLLESLKFWGNDDEKKAEKQEVRKAEAKPADPEAEEKGVPLGEYLKFWETPKDETTREKQYRVKVEDRENGGSDVVVVTQDGVRDRSNTANRITNLLYEQLR